MGIQEGTTGNIAEQMTMALRGVRTEASDMALRDIMGIETPDVVTSLYSVMGALDYPIDPDFAPSAYRALYHTAQSISNLRAKEYTVEQSWMWHQGIYDLDVIGTHHSGKTARLFEIGFLYDEHNNPVIKKVQKHRLGNIYRKWQQGKPEKHTADQIISSLDRTYHRTVGHGYSGAHAYALTYAVSALAFAGDHVLVFPTRENHPEIRLRVEALSQIDQHDPITLSREQLERELTMLQPRVDFGGMLRAIGVTSIQQYREGYNAADIEEVVRIFQSYFTVH